jgi:2,4-dichlorophenol 6-monooxygenase
MEAAATLAAQAGAPIDAIRVGHSEGDYLDSRSTWARWRGHDDTGAVLVRPDRFVAWRATTGSDSALDDLSKALTAILEH